MIFFTIYYLYPHFCNQNPFNSSWFLHFQFIFFWACSVSGAYVIASSGSAIGICRAGWLGEFLQRQKSNTGFEFWLGGGFTLGVSKNNGTSKSSILIGFSITIKSFNPSVGKALPKCRAIAPFLFPSQYHCVVWVSALPQNVVWTLFLKVQCLLENLPISTDLFILCFYDPWMVRSVYDFVIKSG